MLDGRAPPYADRYAYAFNVVHVNRSEFENGVLYLQQLAVRTNEWKYITRPRLDEAELYDLLRDPREESSLADRHAEIVDELHAQVMPFWDSQHDTSDDPREGLAPALVRELQALGYLGDPDED